MALPRIAHFVVTASALRFYNYGNTFFLGLTNLGLVCIHEQRVQKGALTTDLQNSHLWFL